MNRLITPLFLLLATMNPIHAATWEKLPPLPEPAAGFLCGALGEDIVIAGGTHWKAGAKHWLDRIWIFESKRNAWREAGRLDAPLAYCAFGETKDGLYFAGGSTGTETRATLGLLDGRCAVTVIARIEPRFVYASGAILEGKLYVIGGAQDQAQLETMTAACFAIDLKTGAVSRIADLPVPGFVVGAAAACDGRVFVFGGAQWDVEAGEAENLSSAFAFSPSENRWETLRPLPSANRGLTALVLGEHHILLAGGYKNDVEEFTDEAFLFDTTRGDYSATKPLPYRALVALVKSGDHIYCLGGEDKKKQRTDACHRIGVAALLAGKRK